MKTKLQPKGLTFTAIFEAESANYGETIGNVASLKKIIRNKGEQYSYISRQALRYNIIEQLGEDLANIAGEGKGEKKVIQFSKDATIEDYPEIDFFGYLKTEQGTNGKKRSAKVRLSHAISLETYKGDIEFLTNKGLADRFEEKLRKESKEGKNLKPVFMNIAQAEIHKSYYRYTMTMDLDQIGIDDAYEIELPVGERARRVCKLLDTVALLYRDIRGRREDLKPIFIIGGVYDLKNPFFHNAVNLNDRNLDIEAIKEMMFKEIEDSTSSAVISGKFANDSEIKKELKTVTMPEFFETLKGKVCDYYEGR